ncbi:MFS transporter [Sulfobacillus harzensis]|uniref:MFS transporter n=1 Tax=Sulfobacillus harzensis TaxID=2729629 RepID=A0A7Y0L3T7_9FIRM|nr:MFS transporter [Sulfobacillus harzensis]NMP22778.1 MFS transporter [Sulfobacillus harzensis]
MAYIRLNTPDFRRAISALFLGALVTFAVLYSVQPLLPVLAGHFRVSPAEASLSLSFSTLFMGLAMVVAAPLSLRWGPKRIMTLSMASAAVLALASAVTPTFWALLVIRSLMGVALAGLPAVAMGYVSEEIEPQALGQAMGMYVSGTTIGGMGGRILVGMLTDLWGWRGALGMIGGLSILLTVWFFRNLPRTRRFQRDPDAFHHLWPAVRENFRDPGLILLYALPFLLMGSFVTVYNYITFLLTAPPYRLSQTVVGWVFVVYLFGTVSSAWLGRMADHRGRPRMLFLAIALMLAGLLTTLVVWLPGRIAGLALMTFGFFGAHSVASGWVGRRAATSAAQASSLYLFFYYAGSSIFGAVGGIFWSAWRWPGVIGLVSVLVLLALIAAAILSRLKPRTAS